MDSAERLMTERETAWSLGISAGTLAQWRSRGIGPRFVRLGARPPARVLYRRSEIAAWLDEHTHRAASERRGGVER